MKCKSMTDLKLSIQSNRDYISMNRTGDEKCLKKRMLDIPKASQFEVRSVMYFSTSGTYSLYGLPTLQSPLAKI